jgi:BirA family biotin operon repressor/biotin-[acetyl-CoA-carboxylase] ligase
VNLTIAWPQAYGLRRYAVLDSTNEEARRLAQAGEGLPLWIIAERQSAGRGRRGNSWVSEPGNLFATLLMSPSCSPARVGELSFVAALAAGDAIGHYAPEAQVKLKWPNDVLLGGAKVAGILLEAVGPAATPQAMLAVGIGINLAHAPEGLAFPAISLGAATGHAPAAEDMLAMLAARWAAWYDLWTREGFAPIRAAWRERAAGIGETVLARWGGQEKLGMFEDLDETGALMLRDAGGHLIRINAGEVFWNR